MFIKSTRSRGHEYVQIVKSVRKDGTPRHEVVANLGRADILAESGLENMITALKRYVKSTSEPQQTVTQKDISTMKERARVNYGYLAYRCLWKQFGLTQLLERLCGDRQIRYDDVRIVESLVMNHLLTPSSKRHFFRHSTHYFGLIDELELQHVYRCLDVLAEHKVALEEAVFERNRNMFNMSVDVIFYDLTTFHFESQRADELRDFGFSKAGKVNEVQVVLGLLVDRDGRPIGFELFPGNTFEGSTLVKVLRRLQTHFKLGHVVIVADKGLNSKLNLKTIKDAGFEYIISCRIKSLAQKIQQQILSESGYEQVAVAKVFGCSEEERQETEDKHLFKYQLLDYTNIIRYKDEAGGKNVKVELEEKMICTYSSKRAAKDQRDRQRQVEKAQKLVESNQKSALRHRGYKRFIKAAVDGSQDEQNEQNEQRLVLDQDKIDQAACFDGFAALQCSRLDIDPLEALRQYRQLWRIEESFRIIKSTMQTRPIFLRTKQHIEGHFVLCFLAFLLERELEYRLKKREIEHSPEQIKTALNSMEFSVLDIEHEPYYLKGKHLSLASKIFSILRLKQPANIMGEEQAMEYIRS
jgi:transposase